MAPEYDIRIHEGNGTGPVVVLVHGLAVSEKIWTEPENETLFAGLIPFRRLVADVDRPPQSVDKGVHDRPPLAPIAGMAFSPSRWDGDEKPSGLWQALLEAGYATVTWSQREPKGLIALAVEELAHVMDLLEQRFSGRRIVLVGHSRGGLVIRRYLDSCPEGRAKIAGVIGLGVPHRGSRLASAGIILSPVLAFVRGVAALGENNRSLSTRMEDFVSRLNRSLQSEGFLELVPDSPFITGLRDEKYPGMRHVSVIGTLARYTRVYLLKYDEESYVRGADGFRYRLVPRELFTIPDTFVEKIPSTLVPRELVEGEGDGQVSVESARLQWADEEYRFPVNHAEMVVDQRVHRVVLDELKKIELENKGEA